MTQDLVVWYKRGKVVVVRELTVPWENNIDECHEFKKAKYLDLLHERETRAWSVLFPKRPALVVWSKRGRLVVDGEPTVPWENNIDERHEFKKAKYLDLHSQTCTARLTHGHRI